MNAAAEGTNTTRRPKSAVMAELFPGVPCVYAFKDVARTATIH